jgi:phage-related holin
LGRKILGYRRIVLENFLKVTFLGILAVLAPIQAVMISVGFLIFADLITGILAAKKTGKKITSAGIRRTVSKMLVFQIAVISGFVVEIYIGVPLPVAKIVASAIALSELVSVLENVQKITGENVFAKVIKKLGSDNDKKDN